MTILLTATDQFPALGTIVEGGIRADQIQSRRLWTELRRKISAFEKRFSRFQADSELSRLNRNAGHPTPVSPEMMDILAAANSMWKYTEHAVDPTIGRALVRAGYDASFETLDERAPSPVDNNHSHQTTFGDVMIDTSKSTVTVPVDVMLDFGGIGKGYLLDHLVPMIEKITKNYWLSLGGDLIVSGTDEHSQYWSIGVQDPMHPDRDLGQLTPPAGRWGIATSGTMKRRGVRDDVPWHHLIDVATGRPADTDVAAVAVLSPTALEADAMAKAVLLRGSQSGLAWAERKKYRALVITDTSHSFCTAEMKTLFQENA